MRTRTDAPATGRWRFLAVTAAIATAALMGACDNNDATAEASASPTVATPKEALLAALPTKDTERFSFTISMPGATGSGVVDPAANAFQLAITSGDPDEEIQMKISMLLIGDDSWARVKLTSPVPVPGFSDIPDKWFHINKEKAATGAFDLDMSDPITLVTMLDLVGDVTESSPGKYTGTLDLSKTKDLELMLVDDQEVSDAGEKAKAVPFEAEVDSNGRLTSLTLKWPATDKAEAHESKATFSDFGSAPAITAPPASETEEAPESLYSMFS